MKFHITYWEDNANSRVSLDRADEKAINGYFGWQNGPAIGWDGGWHPMPGQKHFSHLTVGESTKIINDFDSRFFIILRTW